jgi:hypothetical protein
MMNFVRTVIVIAVVLAVACAGSGIARAQHVYDILVQQANGQLVSGGANSSGQWTLGRKVFNSEFPTEWATNNPGYGSFGTGSPNLPAGSQTLPGLTALNWDFLPMITNNLSQNLFYWNGLRSDGQPGTVSNDVSFGALPTPTYTLSLFDKTNAKFSTDGTNTVVTGGNIGETNADGSLHYHRYFFLEDNDGSGATSPADGIYLIAMRFRMSGLANSNAVFILFGTPNSTVAALDNAAIPWVEQQLNLSGDYNQNGIVDAADYIVWRDTLNQTGSGLPADGDGSGSVDPADYTLWRSNFGKTSNLRIAAGVCSGATAGLSSSAVPEPSAFPLLLMATLALAASYRYRAPHHRHNIWGNAQNSPFVSNFVTTVET